MKNWKYSLPLLPNAGNDLSSGPMHLSKNKDLEDDFHMYSTPQKPCAWLLHGWCGCMVDELNDGKNEPKDMLSV